MSAPEIVWIVLGVVVPFVGGYSFGYVFGQEAERADQRRHARAARQPSRRAPSLPLPPESQAGLASPQTPPHTEGE